MRTRWLSLSLAASCVALGVGVAEANRHRQPPPGAPVIVPGIPGAPVIAPGTPLGPLSLPHDFKGDPGRGRAAFQARGCPACHRVDGRPGAGGPDLSRVAETRTDLDWYRKYLQDPRSIVSDSIAPPLRVPKEEMDDLIAYLLTLRARLR